MADEYDVVVIGGGSAGENAADYAHRHGLSAVLVERELLGGECSYWACMPSKALLRPPEALAMVRRVPGAAAAVSGSLDVGAVLERRDAFASHWDDRSQMEWAERAGLAVVRGHGRLTGERTVEVTGPGGSTATLRARRAVVIATGSVAAMPPIDGLDGVRVWDSREATTAKDVPRRLLILGGGVVGVEMGQAWKRLGAEQVTIVEMVDRLLPQEEPFAGEELRQVLEAEDIRVLTGTRLVRVERPADDAPLTGTLEDGSHLEAEELLVAVGRKAVTDDLGLEAVGLEPGRPLEVDDHLRVRVIQGGWLYAVGDVNDRVLLTHQGKYQGRVVGAVIAGREEAAWADGKGAPRVVFTDPQVAAVGLTEAQARERGIAVETVTSNVGHTAGGYLLGRDVSGTVQLVIDTERAVIVGATFVGPAVGELLHAATIAMVGEIRLDTLWHAVPAFPTVSEVWLRLLEAYRDRHRG